MGNIDLLQVSVHRTSVSASAKDTHDPAGPQDLWEQIRPPNENKQRLFIQSCFSKGDQPPLLAFGRDLRAGRVGRLCGRRREGFGWALVGGCWHKEAGTG